MISVQVAEAGFQLETSSGTTELGKPLFKIGEPNTAASTSVR